MKTLMKTRFDIVFIDWSRSSLWPTVENIGLLNGKWFRVGKLHRSTDDMCQTGHNVHTDLRREHDAFYKLV